MRWLAVPAAVVVNPAAVLVVAAVVLAPLSSGIP